MLADPEDVVDVRHPAVDAESQRRRRGWKSTGSPTHRAQTLASRAPPAAEDAQRPQAAEEAAALLEQAAAVPVEEAAALLEQSAAVLVEEAPAPVVEEEARPAVTGVVLAQEWSEWNGAEWSGANRTGGCQKCCSSCPSCGRDAALNGRSPLDQMHFQSAVDGIPALMEKMEEVLVALQVTPQVQKAAARFLRPFPPSGAVGADDKMGHHSSARDNGRKSVAGDIFSTRDRLANCDAAGEPRSAGRVGCEASVAQRVGPNATNASGSNGRSVDHLEPATSGIELPEPSSKPSLSYIQYALFYLNSLTPLDLLEFLSGLVIMANTVYIGWNTEFQLTTLSSDIPPVAVALEVFFCVFFVVEIVIRMYLGGTHLFFFDARDWKANWFDLFLVLFGVYDLAVLLIFQDVEGMSMSTLRVIRLLRLLKLLRFIRILKAFRELRLIVVSIVGCLKSIAWALVLVAVSTYLFGIAILQAIANHLQELQDVGSPAFEKERDELMEEWGSLSRVLITMYKATTGGVDWGDPADKLLRHIGSFWYVLFLFYIAYFLFAVMSTVTSLFVDGMMQHSSRDSMWIIQAELEKTDQYVARVKSLFDELDTSGKGYIGAEDVDIIMSDPRMLAFMGSLKIGATEVHGFFNILSEGGTRPIDVETFVVGCIKLTGEAKSVDMYTLFCRQRDYQKELRERLAEIEQRLGIDELDSQLAPAIKRAGSLGLRASIEDAYEENGKGDKRPSKDRAPARTQTFAPAAQ